MCSFWARTARCTCSTGSTATSMSPTTGTGSVRGTRRGARGVYARLRPGGRGARSVDLGHGADHFLLRLLLLLPEELEEQRAAIAAGLSRRRTERGAVTWQEEAAADTETTHGIRITRGQCRCQLRRLFPRVSFGQRKRRALLTSLREDANVGKRPDLPFTRPPGRVAGWARKAVL